MSRNRCFRGTISTSVRSWRDDKATRVPSFGTQTLKHSVILDSPFLQCSGRHRMFLALPMLSSLSLSLSLSRLVHRSRVAARVTTHARLNCTLPPPARAAEQPLLVSVERVASLSSISMPIFLSKLVEAWLLADRLLPAELAPRCSPIARESRTCTPGPTLSLLRASDRRSSPARPETLWTQACSTLRLAADLCGRGGRPA